MKKIFVLAMLIMCCDSFSFAQKTEKPQKNAPHDTIIPVVLEKKHTFFAGLKAGAVFTSMSQPEECDLYDKSGTGFSFGAIVKARFNKANSFSSEGTGPLGVAVELMYKQNTVKTIGTDDKGNANANMSLGYFEVPVYAQFFPFYKTPSMNTLHIDAGLDVAGTMGKKDPKTLTVSGLPGSYGSVTYNVEKLKGLDVRFIIGLGYDFALKNYKKETTSLIGINARYYAGSSDLAKNFSSKMNSFEVSLSWMFRIGRL